ncbi:MAG: DegQ family serine endoprotease [Phycisphaerales bacterium]
MTIRSLLLAGFAATGLAFVPAAHAELPAGLSGDPPTLAPMLEQVTPAVVGIQVTGKARQTPDHPMFNDPFFRRFFGIPDEQQPQQPRGVGSGVIVDADKGIVLTNNHVIQDADEVTVRLQDDRELTAEVVGTDPDSDIAVLQVEADDLTEIPVADSDNLRVGDFVVAIGNPFGLRQTVTSGIVSALGRHGLGNRYEDFIQTDASINPGNSGGALVNLDGELVGINTAILSRSGGNIGIGFAIPTNIASTVVKQIMEFGEVRRGRLGVVGQNLTNELAEAMGLDVTQGVLIAQVVEDSPADQAGIKERDVITGINGNDIKDFSELANAIGLRSPGEKVRIKLLRDGETRNVTATLSKADDSQASASSEDSGFPALEGAKIGAIPEDHDLAGEIEGVAVLDIARGSPAASSGLRPGDIITSVNRRPVDSLEAFRELVNRDAQQLLLHVRRGNGALFLLVR